MAEKFFAFVVAKVSIDFGLRYALGDSVVARKVFDALTEIEPNCKADIFYMEERHRIFAEAFFSGSKNLNRILSREKFYKIRLGFVYRRLPCYSFRVRRARTTASNGSQTF